MQDLEDRLSLCFIPWKWEAFEGFQAEKCQICLNVLTVQDTWNHSLIKFADSVTDSFSGEMEVQTKREPLGLQRKCDFSQKLQRVMGRGEGEHLLGTFSRKPIAQL